MNLGSGIRMLRWGGGGSIEIGHTLCVNGIFFMHLHNLCDTILLISVLAGFAHESDGTRESCSSTAN